MVRLHGLASVDHVLPASAVQRVRLVPGRSYKTVRMREGAVTLRRRRCRLTTSDWLTSPCRPNPTGRCVLARRTPGNNQDLIIFNKIAIQ